MNETVLAIAAIVGFLLLWAAIISFIAFVGGWHALSKSYAVDKSRALPLDYDRGERFGFATMSMGPTSFPANYGTCLTIWVSDRGIELRAYLYLRIMHPPLFIPWTAITLCEERKFFFLFTRTAVYANDTPDPLQIQGLAGREILRRWNERALVA